MTTIQSIILGVYFVLLALFCVHGLHKYHMIWKFLHYRKNRHVPPRRFAEEELPVVTVQLPMFNESAVAERVIDAACGIRYPKGRLEIQVLDDSTDESQDLARRKVEEMRALGHDIHYLHRTDRTGYKAGALEKAMEVARGEFFAVFDADFVPAPDFLEKTIHHFTNTEVGMVQMRWDHLNRSYNLLTRVQSLFLDGHFIIESTSRCRSGCFVNFNGTAGIWRRQAIDDAGGWEHDTVTEDLDLSYRSQLAGWRFVYLLEEGTPAELPVEVNAFKSQQHRWAKGTVQTMKKLLPRIWRADLTLRQKVEATFHLGAYVPYLMMVTLLVLMLPAMLIRLHHRMGMGAMVLDLFAFVLVTVSFFTFYIVSQTEGGREWKKSLRYLPFLLAMGIGMAVNNTKAILEGLFGADSTFVRTPKYGAAGRKADEVRRWYKGNRSYQPLMELALGGYFAVILYTSIHYRAWFGIPFTALFLAGFSYIGICSILERRARARA